MQDFMMSSQKQAYLEGALDCISSIEKTLNQVKEIDGKYPTMDRFVQEWLPAFRDINIKMYEVNK